MKQIGEGKRAVGNPPQHFERVAVMDADVAERQARAVIARDMDQRLRHPVHERLAADEAVVGQHVGAGGEVLAAAEADLEMERAVMPEQALGGDGAFRRHRDPRQQPVDEPLLPRAQRLALGAPVEPVEGGRIAGFVRGHARSG